MASFTVRVELHDAKTYQDYEILHEAMGEEGFNRTIEGSSGTTYELPTAEYVLNGNLTIKQALARAKRAAKKTGKSFGVLVSETVRRMWSGLSEA
jgi:hypothetical protein